MKMSKKRRAREDAKRVAHLKAMIPKRIIDLYVARRFEEYRATIAAIIQTNP